ncbi:MAG: hypothetical protein WC856_15040 [Methylococcaceae bacterium]|jgi:hypothetical protein
MAQLKPEQWQAIRTSYEHDIDKPSVEVAAERAALKFNFKPPHRSAIYFRLKKDETNGAPWVRVSSMHGINIVAQKKADQIAIDKNTDEKLDKKLDEKSKLDANPIKKAQASKEESEDLRASVLVRHREDLSEARNGTIAAKEKHKTAVTMDDKRIAFEDLKAAKIHTETLRLTQDGERKAWNLDDPPDLSKYSIAQLEEAKITGKLPRLKCVS